ncbi:MAG: histidine phosphatase family protein [Candidatus Binatia bacterium]
MQILLLRHGETDWNLQGRCQGAADLDLNRTGTQQAKDTAIYLSREKIDAVYSSDLKRALQTAGAISQLHNLAVNIEENFRELNHGDLEGLTFPDIRAAFPDLVEKWRDAPAELTIPGGERLIDVEHRTWDGMNRIIESHRPEETVVIVSHRFPILAVLCRITDTPLNQRSFQLDPCGVNYLTYSHEGGWKVTRINHRPPTELP